jgi:hypothetical protein
MTLAEFVCVMDGFGRFHAGRDDDGPALRDAFRQALEAEAEAGRL